MRLLEVSFEYSLWKNIDSLCHFSFHWTLIIQVRSLRILSLFLLLYYKAFTIMPPRTTLSDFFLTALLCPLASYKLQYLAIVESRTEHLLEVINSRDDVLGTLMRRCTYLRYVEAGLMDRFYTQMRYWNMGLNVIKTSYVLWRFWRMCRKLLGIWWYCLQWSTIDWAILGVQWD